ncbi:hypothetical protein [Faecalibaculum rodentium]|uniref:hypothetical protein n=2 Tax=Faecalibaculum rodentium TaxID=1702221 RepID=UPI00272FDB9A|nr:hypothetical protein [Faecalibaculum rodentium]
MDSGWIKLHRKLTEWEWYTDVPTKTLFIHLLLTVNYEPGKWRGADVPKGAKITSREKLAKETGLSQQQIRTALNKLESTSEITKSTTSTYTLIQLTNYEKYQDTNQVCNQRPTSDQPASNQRPTTIKESKKERRQEEYKSSKQKVITIGPHENVNLPAAALDSFLSRFPETGQAAIDELSERLYRDPQKKVTNTIRYLEAIAADPELKPKSKSGPFSGQLPDWYSDTGSEFASEQEHQQMLAMVNAEKARYEKSMKGKS